MKKYQQLVSITLLSLLLSRSNAFAQSGEGYYGPTTNSGLAAHGVSSGANAFFIAPSGTYDGVSFGPSTDAFDGPGFVPGTQEISGTIAPSFSTLQLSNGSSSAFNVTNTAGIDVAAALQLNNGITSTVNTVAGAIRMAAAATATGTFSATSYVDGYMAKAGATSFLFPVGNGGIYSPTTFSNPAGTTLRYTVADPGTTTTKSTSQAALNLATVSKKEFYPLSSAAVSGSSVTIPYGNFTGTYVADPASLTIAGWNGTAWVNLGSLTNTINTGGQTVTVALNQSLTGITQIALASTSALNPLPVTLISFNGIVANCTALLSWKTATELNSKNFIIEHSSDGINFNKTGSVASLNSSIGGSYSFTDYNLASGTNYYRLKSVDIDGKFATSNTISLKSICNSLIITAWPNPVKDVVTIAGLTGNNTIIIMDAAGKRMTNVITSNTSRRINMGGFAKGAYTIQVINDNGSITNIRVIK